MDTERPSHAVELFQVSHTPTRSKVIEFLPMSLGVYAKTRNLR